MLSQMKILLEKNMSFILFFDSLSNKLNINIIKIYIILYNYSISSKMFKWSVLEFINKFIKLIIGNLLKGGPYIILTMYGLYIALFFILNIPYLSISMLTAVINNPYLFDFYGEIPFGFNSNVDIPYVYISGDEIPPLSSSLSSSFNSSAGSSSSGMSGGSPGGSPGGLPPGIGESALVHRNNEDNLDIVTHSNGDIEIINKQKDVVKINKHGEIEHINNNREVIHVNRLKRSISDLGPICKEITLNTRSKDDTFFTTLALKKVESYLAYWGILAWSKIDHQLPLLSESGGVSECGCQSVSETVSDRTSDHSDDSYNSVEERNFHENQHWNEMIVEHLNKLEDRQKILYGTPVTPLNTTACFTNEDLKVAQYDYTKTNVGIFIPTRKELEYMTNDPYTKVTTVDGQIYRHCLYLGVLNIVTPSYFYLDSNGESTYIDLGVQYHFYPVNNDKYKDVYHCLVTLPNSETILFTNKVELQNFISDHKCSLMQINNPFWFLFKNPYTDYSNELIFNYIKDKTNNFSVSTPPYVNNELYRYNMVD